MKKYILRLDDACEKMDVEKWLKVESLLDKYSVKPLVGVIPFCEDPAMEKYPVDPFFWETVRRWSLKGWIVAMHGYNHVYSSKEGGINPVNQRSEFAGESLIIQKDKIKKGVTIFKSHGFEPHVFFAPSHTFDRNTLIALLEESSIRFISDTIAWDCYREDHFIFIPQQSGRVRSLPFKTITFCYHPNSMEDKDFKSLESFILKHKFSSFPTEPISRKKGILDKIMCRLYFLRKGIHK